MYTCVYIYICILRDRDKDRENESKSAFICRFILQMFTMTPSLGLIQEWGTQSSSPCGWQEANCLNHHLLPPKMCVSRKLPLGVKGGNQGQPLGYGLRASQADS